MRVDDDLLVFLEPAIGRLPRDTHVPVDLGLRLRLDRHVLDRERVPGKPSRLVHEHRALAVHDRLVACKRTYATRPRLDVHNPLGRLEVQSSLRAMAERACT